MAPCCTHALAPSSKNKYTVSSYIRGAFLPATKTSRYLESIHSSVQHFTAIEPVPFDVT